MSQSYKVFIINLPRDTERKKFMSDQLNRLGFEYEFITAFYGDDKKVIESCNDEVSLKYNKALLGPGERGCAYSHRHLHERVVRGETEYAIIMEDDVELSNNFKEAVEQEIENRSKGKTAWEYLSFNYPTVGLKFIHLWLFLFLRMFKEKRSLKLYLKLPLFLIKFIAVVIISFFERVREIIYGKMYTYGKPGLFYRPLYLAGCYVINKKGAEKLLSLSQKLVYTADRLPNVARVKKSLKYFAFVPLLVKQKREMFGSNITGNAKKDAFKF